MIALSESTAKIIAATRAESGAIVMADYHGSIFQAHGAVRVLRRSGRDRDRFDLLAWDGAVLRGARAASFTLA